MTNYKIDIKLPVPGSLPAVDCVQPAGPHDQLLWRGPLRALYRGQPHHHAGYHNHVGAFINPDHTWLKYSLIEWGRALILIGYIYIY